MTYNQKVIKCWIQERIIFYSMKFSFEKICSETNIILKDKIK